MYVLKQKQNSSKMYDLNIFQIRNNKINCDYKTMLDRKRYIEYF